MLEITRHQPLHTAAVKPDELSQKADRQQIVALRFLLDDDLGQDRAGDVLARFRIIDDEVAAFLDHPAEVVEGHITARRRVVEAPIRIFLDDDRGCLGRGGLTHSDGLSQHSR